MKISCVIWLFVAVFTSTHAAVIFDNGPTNGNGGFTNDPTFDASYGYYQTGDNFSVTSSTILAGISWYGGYTQVNNAVIALPPVASEGFQFTIYQRETSPVPVATFVATPLTRTDVGIGQSLRYYSYTAALPALALAQGEYILNISVLPHIDPYAWFWGNANTSKKDVSFIQMGNPAADWLPYNTEFAFTLYDATPGIPEIPVLPSLSPVPELSIVGPASAGLLILLTGRNISRRKQRSPASAH